MKCKDCGLTTKEISNRLSGGEVTIAQISATERCKVTGLFHHFEKEENPTEETKEK